MVWVGLAGVVFCETIQFFLSNIKNNLKGRMHQHYINVARFWLYVLILIQFGRDFDRESITPKVDKDGERSPVHKARQ